MSEEHERARALAEVLRDQAARIDAARDAEERRYRRTRTRRLALVGMWLGAAYIWIFSPSWTNIEPPERPPIQQEAQALRVNLFLETQAIEAYRAERGRLPYVLQEAGPPFPDIEYVRRDSHSYELRGASDRVRLRYFSEEPPLDFVGNAAELLTAAPRARAGQDQ
ncbi:MAG TPA: hypothetical protein VJ997_02540 [Longimicrobiales bacterium]|nr:hypothetical protein [Longimicrobiales bacterium]